MAAPTFRYRAFLSYSHVDKAIGERLHATIERYAIPAGLTAGAGKDPLPPGLRPIFRDKSDLEAGHSLTEQIRTALAESDALIVLCSPHSAKSKHVNEEIRLFKMAGRAKRIFAVIIDGRPGDPHAECFPEMLCKEVAADGTPGGAGDEPIAADVRDDADGWELATLKLIAGILCVDLDQLRRRDDVERRRKLRRSRMLAVAMAVLALAATGTAAVAWSLNVALAKSEREAVDAKLRAEESQRLAEERYTQALKSTLKLVTVAASLGSIADPPVPFRLSMIQRKGESSDFQEYLTKIDDQDRVWFGLVEVLMTFENRPPPELRPFATKLAAAGMPLQWAQHAQRIMQELIDDTRNRTGRGDKLAQYEREMAKIEAEVARLSGGRGGTRSASAAAVSQR